MAHNETRGSDPRALDLLTGPAAPDSATFARWAEGARRRRLLEGLWKEDLKRALAKEYSPRRRRLLGVPDTTKNLFRSLVTQLSVLYDRPPIVQHEDEAAVSALNALADGAGLWQLAIHLQQLTMAQREGIYRFDVPPPNDGADPKLLVRIVPVDLVTAGASPDDPDNPHTFIEHRQRTIEGVSRWTRDVLSIADPANPVFRVEDSEGKVDLSDRFLPAGGLSGEMYPYRKADGAPILPVSLYHAKRTGRLWDPWTGAELVDGTLTVAGLWTMWRHMVRDASWPQRWALNAGVEGLEPNRETGDMAVDLDPAALLNFRAKMPGQASSIGQFDPGGDPESLGQAIRQYSADLLQDFDLSPADIARTNSDARSGHAIEITRDGQRSAQRRMEPQFRRGDETTLSVIAILWNRATGAELPEDGWSIKYLGLPLSMQERKLVLEDHAQRAALKIASRVDLLAAVEGITLDQARRRLLVIELDEAAFPGINSAGPSGSTAPTPNKDSGGSNRPEPDHG